MFGAHEQMFPLDFWINLAQQVPKFCTFPIFWKGEQGKVVTGAFILAIMKIMAFFINTESDAHFVNYKLFIKQNGFPKNSCFVNK